MMGKTERSPGDPYEVGFGKPPKQTQFRRGRSGNPYGRPPKKPDLHGELTKVLRENVTITIDGQPEKVTVQQALLLRLRDQALRGELWAQKLLQKVLGALPERGTEDDYIERQLEQFRFQALINLVFSEASIEQTELAPGSEEFTNDE